MPDAPSPVFCRLVPALAGEMARIEAESNSPPWSEDLFKAEFSHVHARVMGARLEGKLVGFLICHVVQDEGHIVNFGVAVAYRGRKIGRALIEEVLLDLFREGVRWMTLEVRRSNQVARNLYESLGFMEVGTREHYYTDDGEDAVVLKLNLSQFASQRT
ncbi:MAG: ribosomal protein S18-alanine N-acetyltransferase [Oligoflexia bacterium]|nr:ribosomal protein S18-alanine N-acetyltransferase [Oligoflexia bacterium]